MERTRRTLLSILVRMIFWPSVGEIVIKLLCSNVPPSKAVSALIFPLKMSGLAMRDYEDDDSEEGIHQRWVVCNIKSSAHFGVHWPSKSPL